MPETETATLAGGCFWCIEAVYRDTKGVISSVSGYMGGAAENPSYEAVCSGRSGHAEVVRVTFDPALISFRDILEIFFVIHDPTSLNRQGNDVGSQYRSAIFYHSPEQKATAEEVVRELTADKAYRDPIVTAIVPETAFWPAEEYHQDYFSKNPDLPYCSFVVAPKVRKFRNNFAAQRKSA